MNSLYGNFRNFKFSDIWDNATDFLADYKDNGIYDASEGFRLTDNHVNLVFYLLYARYANSVIASSDPTQFAYKVWSIMFEYGPTWEKQLEIQKNLRNLTEAEIKSGAEQIHNHAFNPSQEPATDAYSALGYTNEQTASKYKKGVLDGYNELLVLLKTDVTKAFIDRFSKLFLTIVEPELPL